MNESPDPEDPLRRLLRWKRHEQPPPGYFHELADRVIARLERGQALPGISWWEKFVARFEVKPVLVGAYGLAVCGLMLFGISVSQLPSVGSDSASAATGGGSWSTALAAPGAQLPGPPSLYSLPMPLATASLSSMAPVVKQPTASLVEGNTEFELTPVNFTFRIR